MDLQEYAEMIFLGNGHDKQQCRPLTLEGSENTKDIFCVCVDLMCKGLILLFGVDGHVNISELDPDQFCLLKSKMTVSGLSPVLTVEPLTDPLPDWVPRQLIRNSINSEEIQNFPESMPLENYVFSVKTADKLYSVRFHITETYGKTSSLHD